MIIKRNFTIATQGIMDGPMPAASQGMITIDNEPSTNWGVVTFVEIPRKKKKAITMPVCILAAMPFLFNCMEVRP